VQGRHTMLSAVLSSDEVLVRLTPPQSKDGRLNATRGAYLYVIDVSGSMNASADVTTEDGDKVSHGWSLLDIAKHATCTCVACLGDEDWVSVITYTDGASVLLDWTQCTAAGKESATAAIHSMRPERSTNLMAGMTLGYEQMGKVPIPADALATYALNLIITTDGIPSSQWHPARGRDGYKPLSKMLCKKLCEERGLAARPVTTTVGLGYQLDSELLCDISDSFLHMPDPGAVGPFMVNMLASQRCTAMLPTADGAAVAANQVALLISPSSAIAPGSFLGYDGQRAVEAATDADGSPALRVSLGAVLYDQPRHCIFKLKEGEATPRIQLQVSDSVIIAVLSPGEVVSPSAAQLANLAQQSLRLRAVDEVGKLDVPSAPADGINGFIAELAASDQLADPAVTGLKETFSGEVLLGLEATNRNRWGKHYLRTLPRALLAEKRTNFRDQALQYFGKDATGSEALFESICADAEMKFATLKPPEPSLLAPNRAPAQGVPVAGAVAAPPSSQPMYAMPEEFMRGGGCFGPDAVVTILAPSRAGAHAADADAYAVDGDAGGDSDDDHDVGEGVCGDGGSVGDGGCGHAVQISIRHLRAGDLVLTPSFSYVRVRCVVVSECVGGRAMLSRLPSGLEITEWHPVFDSSASARGGGRWRFPILLGTRVIRPCSHVYNVVLEAEHVLLANGIPCVTLGHGLRGETVGHAYYGTGAVLADLATKRGWKEGRVLLTVAEQREQQRRIERVQQAAQPVPVEPQAELL